MENLPASIGISEIREIFGFLEREAMLREKQLMAAAKEVSREEEILDALFVRYQDLEVDYRRAEFLSESTLTDMKSQGLRKEEINNRLSDAECQLPVLSETRAPPSFTRDKFSNPEDIFHTLELLCQKYGFLMDRYRRVAEHSDPQWKNQLRDVLDRSDISDPSPDRYFGKPRSQPVDPLCLKISEAKVTLDEMVSELNQIADKLRAQNSSEH